MFHRKVEIEQACWGVKCKTF